MIFRRKDSHRPSVGRTLCDSAVRQARAEALYAAMGAPDTIEGRFELLTLHVILLVEALRGGGEAATVETFGRHDPCVGIRATPIAEAMLALVLIDHALRHRAQCGDVVVSTPKIAASDA